MRSILLRAGIVAAVALVVVSVNRSVLAKEHIIRKGQRIYLELAPVDPRSLMQGDYMALRFAITRDIPTDASGSAPLQVAANGVATLARDAAPATARIRYRIRNRQVWLGTNAYFFEEGNAQDYEGARYGEFRLDPDSGDAVLVGLADENLQHLGPAGG